MAAIKLTDLRPSVLGKELRKRLAEVQRVTAEQVRNDADLPETVFVVEEGASSYDENRGGTCWDVTPVNALFVTSEEAEAFCSKRMSGDSKRVVEDDGTVYFVSVDAEVDWDECYPVDARETTEFYSISSANTVELIIARS